MAVVESQGEHGPDGSGAAEPAPGDPCCGAHALDRLAGLAARLLGAPMALASLIDRERALHAGCAGLPEPASSNRSTPLSHSLCPHVSGGESLVAEDARRDPRLAHSPILGTLGAVSCAVLPITADGVVLGAFAVLDRVPRRWTEAEQRALEDLAAAAAEELRLAQAVRAHAEIVELLQSTLRAREREMSAAAHDLRSPLHGALLVLQILETQGSTAESNGVLGRALRSMGEIITKRLGSAALKRQGFVTPLVADPGELLARAQGALAARAAAQEIELASRLEEDLPEVWADPARLAQALASILGSALRCAGRGGRVDLAARADADGGVRFEVRAAGERCVPLDGDPHASLGWSAARALVLAHGGEAGAEPGPCFWFTLPQAHPEHELGLRRLS